MSAQPDPPAATTVAAREHGGSSQARLQWVDVAKGVCITLVVLLHVTNFLAARELTSHMWVQVNGALEPVRMPLFFLTAGLFAQSVLTATWRTVLGKRIILLAYLYLLWMALRFAFFTAVPAAAGTDETASGWNLLVGLVNPGTGLWFLYALALFAVAAKVLAPLRVRWQLVFAGVLVLVAPLVEPVSWSWRHMLGYFVFFLLGLHARELVLAVARARSVRWLLVAAAVYAAAFVARQSLAEPMLAVATVLCTCVGLLVGVFAAALAKAKAVRVPLARLGVLTLPVYLMHEMLLGLLVALAVVLGLDFTHNAIVVSAPIVVTVLVVLACLALRRGLVALRLDWLFAVPEGVLRATRSAAQRLAPRAADHAAAPSSAEKP